MPTRKIKKDELLLKTAEVFRKKGYYGTSMDELAKACGLYKASFYYYYPGKEELVCAILDYFLDKLRNDIDKIFTNSINREEMKDKFLHLYSDWCGGGNKGHLFSMIGIETAQTSNELRVSIRQAYQTWVNAFTRILSGKYLEVEAGAMAHYMISELEGAATLSRIMGNLTYFQDTLQRINTKLR
jgi:TetR/AcrR family transcriptional repressor of nem operon